MFNVLTRKEQTLMLEFLLKDKIRKKTQSIYLSNSEFYGIMKDFKDKGLVKTQKTNNSGKIYSLTFQGFIRANLIALDENNGSRYSNLGNPNIINVLRTWKKFIG